MARNVPLDTASYLLHGCGRCSLFDTPACKVHAWQQELRLLLDIVRAHNVDESIKWSVPVFSVNGNNVMSVTAFKPHASLNFFAGSSLDDEQSLLVMPGENSATSRVYRCTDTASIRRDESALHRLVEQAVQQASDPARTAMKRPPATVDIPEEFTRVMSADPTFASAFDALTPGRRRGYLLHFGSAKQSSTRLQRIEKARARILQGKGMQDE